MLFASNPNTYPQEEDKNDDQVYVQRGKIHETWQHEE
jgi:hypothetical protein